MARNRKKSGMPTEAAPHAYLGTGGPCGEANPSCEANTGVRGIGLGVGHFASGAGLEESAVYGGLALGSSPLRVAGLPSERLSWMRELPALLLANMPPTIGQPFAEEGRTPP